MEVGWGGQMADISNPKTTADNLSAICSLNCCLVPKTEVSSYKYIGLNVFTNQVIYYTTFGLGSRTGVCIRRLLWPYCAEGESITLT